MYGVSTMVDVKELEPGKRILVELRIENDPTKVEWTFESHLPDTTFVSITNIGFSGDGDKIIEQAMESATGYELMLVGLKAYPEDGRVLNLIEDRYPDQLMNHRTETR